MNCYLTLASAFAWTGPHEIGLAVIASFDFETVTIYSDILEGFGVRLRGTVHISVTMSLERRRALFIGWSWQYGFASSWMAWRSTVSVHSA